MGRLWTLLMVGGGTLLASPGAGCGGGDSSGPSGGGTGGSAGAVFSGSACAKCERSACDADVKACESDPECAAYLACEGKCPVGTAGDVDPTCQAACKSPASSTGQGKLDTLSACRYAGAGSGCTECGRSPDAGDAGGAAGATGCTMPGTITQTCAPVTGGTACTDCQSSKCCDSVSAVFDGGPATDLKDCWLGCTSPQCENDCYDQFPNGVQAFGEYQACNALNCSAKGACKSPTPCAQCQYDSCGCEYATCVTNVDCFRIFHCFSTCAKDDVACGLACRQKFVAGDKLYERLGVCVTQHCVQSCGV
ncbi:MAG: hypothetical protein IPI67_26985 [Myxococcales bacterium]|nr:hypothetical protein [Myxococcales bacterium]